MAHRFTDILLKISNVLVFIFFLGGNIYSSFGPVKHDSPYESHPSYITPAHWTFFLWTIIHLLLGGFIIYQWFPHPNEAVHHGVGWQFVIATLLNGVWLALWTSGHTYISIIAIFFVSGSISYVYYRLKTYHVADNIWDTLFIHLPFSLYHAWISFLLLLNIFAAFGPVHKHGPGVWGIFFAIVGMIFIASHSIVYIEYKQGDVVSCLVLVWVLFGIFARQDDPAIHWTALVLAILVLIYTIKPFVLRLFRRRRENEETRALIA